MSSAGPEAVENGMAGTVRFPTDAQESIAADSAHFSGNQPLPEKDRITTPAGR